MPPQSTEIRDKTARLLSRCLRFRRQYDAPRLILYRQYIGQRDTQYFPDRVTPRSNTFIKYPFANVDAITARVQDAFFSYLPWFQVNGRGVNDADAAEAMQLVLAYMLQKSQFIQAFEMLLKNILIYGHGAIKVDWDWATDTVQYAEPQYAMQPGPNGQPVPLMDPNTGQPIVMGYKPASKQVPRMCPKFYPIDVFDLLVDPDGGITAHMTERAFGDLKREAQAKPDAFDPQGFADLTSRIGAASTDPDSVTVRMAEVWNEIDDTCTLMTYGEDREAIGLKDARYAYRATAYSPYKRQLYGGENIVLYHSTNDFPHKKSPILHTSYVKVPGEVYGLGAVELISDLVESLNKAVNMIQDNWNLGINKRYAINTDADIDHESLNNFNVPGGKVFIAGNPNDALMELPTHTPSEQDYQIIPLFKNVIEMTSGISDFYAQGVGTSANDTASGINSIITETNYKFRMFIRNLELDIVQPMLQMCASMVQRYITDEYEVSLTQENPTIEKYPRVRPEELIGTFDFDIMAANYATNKTVRQRNILAFANWAAQSPYWDPYGGSLEIAKAFEIPNPHKMLKQPQQVQMEQQMAQQQQLHMAALEHMAKTESKATVAAIAKKEPNTVTAHAKDVVEHIEALLMQAGELPPGAPPQHGQPHGGGRPRQNQLEGKMPGTGNTGPMREGAQQAGANGLGLEGLQES